MNEEPTIYLGADHGGFALKGSIASCLKTEGFPIADVGSAAFDPNDDYPFAAIAVAVRVAHSQAAGKPALGILLCRSGAGMAIAAGKICGIRAAVGADEKTAVHARSHNDANVLSLGADTLREEDAINIVRVFLRTPASGEPRHRRRIKEITRMESAILEVTPGIFETTANGLEEKIRLIPKSVPWVHIDIADGDFVPAQNAAVLNRLPRLPTGMRKEAHLMVTRPADFVATLAAAGFDRLVAHVEAKNIDDFIRQTKTQKKEVGLAVDLPTSGDAVTPFARYLDTILIMSVKAGASGQVFAWETLPKIVSVRDRYPGIPIAVDGGITDMTAPLAKAAGATSVVSTSYLFKHPDGVNAALERLKTYA